MLTFTVAGVAQLVERNLAKVEVEGSRPFSRSSVSVPFQCLTLAEPE